MALNANANKLSTVQRNNNKTTEYWNKYLLGMIVLERSNFVFSTLGKETVIPVNSGTTTISYRRYNHLPVSPNLVAEQLAEGTPPTPLKVEAQKVQGVVNQYGAYIELTDWVDTIHDDDIKSIYMPELARHAAEVIERNIMMSFGEASEWYVNNRANIDAITANDVLTLQEIRKAVLTQKNYRRQGHPKFGNKPVVVMHVNVMQDLLDDDDLKDRVLVPGNDNSPIKSGTLQQYQVYGYYFVETLIAEVEQNSSGVNVYKSVLLGKDPYMVIKLGTSNVKYYHTAFEASKDDPLGQRATFGYKLWTGAKVVDPMAITIIHSASKFDITPNWNVDNLGAPASQTASQT